MHTVLTRGNAILAYTLSVLACLTFCCFISTVFLDYRTGVKINAVKSLVKNVPNYGNNKELNDLGFITFDLQTDLSGLFNWNVKQLFLYLTAEYKTENNELNQVREEKCQLDVTNCHFHCRLFCGTKSFSVATTPSSTSRT